MPADSPSDTLGDATTADERRALLAETIAACRRRLTLGWLAYRLLQVLAVAAVFPLFAVVADHALPGGLPHAVIFGMGIVWGLATILTATGVSVGTAVRRLNRVFVARHVERSRGIPHNPLVNMVLLERTPAAEYARDAAVRQAASVVASSAPEAPGSAVSLRQPGLLLLAAVGVWLVYAAITPKPILPSLARLFGSDRTAPTATRLELVRPQPDDAVYVGEPLEIEFAVSGRSAEQVWFELLNPVDPDAPPILRSALERTSTGGAEVGERCRIMLAAHEVQGDLHYRCAAGDAALEGVIVVLPQPDLVELEIEAVPPAYVGESPLRTRKADLRVWSGTRATFVATANTEMRDSIFVLRGESETRTRMFVEPAQPRRATLSLSLTASGEYWIEFSDQRGRPCCDPPAHQIVVRQDAAPQIEIVAPTREEAPDDVVDVTYVAWLRALTSDDVRLDGVFLVRDVDGTISREELLEPGAAARGRSVELGVATSDLGLEIGESLEAWFEAHDNRVLRDGTPAPQTSRTRMLMLIRTPEVVAAPEDQVAAETEATEEAESGTTVEEVVKRHRVRDGEEGTPAEAGAEGEQDAAAAGGRDSSSDVYRRASGGPNGEAQAEDGEQAPDILDPLEILEAEDESDTEQKSADTGEESAQQSAALDRFKEEFRRFCESHGDEADEVNKRTGSRAADAQSDESRPGQGGSGATGEQDLPNDSSQPPSEESTDAGQVDASELERPPPQSQPSGVEQDQREDAEGEQGPQATAQDERPAGGTQEGQRDQEGEAAPREGSEQSEADRSQTAGNGQRQQPDGRSDTSKQDRAEGDRAGSDAGPQTQEGEAQQPAQPEQGREQQSGTDGAQQGRPEELPDQSAAGSEPGAGGGERVVPVAGAREPAEIEPSVGPQGPEEEPRGDAVPDTGGRADAIDTLELLQRGEELSEDELVDMGWPALKAQGFIRDFERLREAARRAGVLQQLKWWRSQAELGSGAVAPGSGLSEDVSTGVAGGVLVSDGLDQIAPPPEQNVPAELQAVLDAYYRSLAERRAQQREADPSRSP